MASSSKATTKNPERLLGLSLDEILRSADEEEYKFVLTRSYPLFAAYYFDYEVAPFHAEMQEHIDATQRSLTLCPAGHGKTSQESKVNICRNIVMNRNIRIILTMKTAEDAASYCKSIQNELTDNRRLVHDFGSFYNPDRWTTTQFCVSGRQHNDAHDTLEVFGTGSWKQLGHRCDIVVLDDVVTEESCATPEARKKQLDWFRMAVQTGPQPMWPIDRRYGLQVPAGVDWPHDAPYNPRDGSETYGQIIVVGTRFHPFDLYKTLSEDKTYAFKRFDCWTDEDATKPLWPRRWSNDALRRERESLGIINFNKRYRNEPMDESELVFRREWFTGDESHPGCFDVSRSYGELPKDGDGKPLDCFRALGLDPASGTKSRYATWPSFVLLGFPNEGDPGIDKRYLIDTFRRQMGMEHILDTLYDGNPSQGLPGFYAKYHYDVAKIESNGFGTWLFDHHRTQEARRRGVRVESHWTQKNKIDPSVGIASMEAILRDGLVSFPYKTEADRKQSNEIAEQFITFPKGLYDFVMAFWFAELAVRSFKMRFKRYNTRSSRYSYTVHNPVRDRNR